MNLTKLIFVLVAILMVAVPFCTSKSQDNGNSETESSKSLVAYFSATGTTAKVAQRIASITGSDLLEIVPVERYTDADLDWRDSLSRSTVEMMDRNSRPSIVDTVVDMSKYSIVYIGYPNWWNTAPRIINTWIESNNLDGKIIVPFMTSGGGGIEQSELDLSEAYPALNWKKGMLLNDVTDEEIRELLNEN